MCCTEEQPVLKKLTVSLKDAQSIKHGQPERWGGEGRHWGRGGKDKGRLALPPTPPYSSRPWSPTHPSAVCPRLR